MADLWNWFKGTSMPFWHKRVLARPGEPSYMVRYHLFLSRWITVYLNCILTPDRDPRLHTHPWWRCYSVKLRGGYWEQVPVAGCARCRGELALAWVNGGGAILHRPPCFSRVPERHRIIELLDGPVWTIFIGLGAKRPWGFQNSDGTIEERT